MKPTGQLGLVFPLHGGVLEVMMEEGVTSGVEDNN